MSQSNTSTPRMSMLDPILGQARMAGRALRRAPGFTLVTGLTLALGIGSATTVFGILSAAFLQPLPYRDPDRLVALSETRRGEEISISYPDFLDFQAGNHTLDDLALYAGRSMALGNAAASPERIRGQVVSTNLFRTLGVAPLLGRSFTPDEDHQGTERVAIIGHGLWQRRFAGDTAIIGRVVSLDREPFIIVGVMPPDFDFPGGLVFGPAELWIPAGLAVDDDWTNRQSHPGIQGIGRLRPGVTLAQAAADLTAIADRLREAYPDSNQEQGVLLRGALEGIVGSLRPGLTLVASAVLLLLLITCANVAGLMLARGVARHREIAIRSALGARRSRIVSQLLAESLLLAAMGGAAGLALAWWGTRLAAPVIDGLPRLTNVPLDWRVLVFAIGVTLLSGLVCGVGPALAATGETIDRWLRERGRSTGVLSGRVRSALVAGEIALSLMLVIGASLLSRSFATMRAAPGGIDPVGVLTFEVRLPEAIYGAGDPVARFYQHLVESAAALPGVSAVGGISTLPFSGAGAQSGLTSEGITERQRTDVAVVTPDYFRAMGVALLRGRLFTARDDAAAPPVGVVDERLAERFWPGKDPLGQVLHGWGFRDITVIGVVRHVKNYGVASDSRQELYVSHAQRPANRMIMAMRTSGNPDALVAPVRRIVGAMDPDLPIYNVRTMQAVVDATVQSPRLSAAVSGLVAGLSLLLAAVGLHGVLAFMVGQRTHEFGVRMALGAAPGAVARAVARQSMGVALTGVAIGTAGAIGVVRLVRSQLFGVSPIDTTSLGLTALAFVVVTVGASWIPARRAARVPPATALGSD